MVVILSYVPTNSARGFPSLHPHQHLLLLELLILAILKSMR